VLRHRRSGLYDLPVADAIFEQRRLAEIYDPLDPNRSDLEVYAALVEAFGARTVLDIGCGTGTFACLLAARAHGESRWSVSTPQAPHSRLPVLSQERIRCGGYTVMPRCCPLQVDLATMTANVAQVFLTDEEWASTLRCVHAALRRGGCLVFETRDPEKQVWRTWDHEHSYTRTDIPQVGTVEAWTEITDVRDEFVSFRSTFVFEQDGAVLTSDSTLRFRDRDQVADSLLTGSGSRTQNSWPPGTDGPPEASKCCSSGPARGELDAEVRKGSCRHGCSPANWTRARTGTAACRCCLGMRRADGLREPCGRQGCAGGCDCVRARRGRQSPDDRQGQLLSAKS